MRKGDKVFYWFDKTVELAQKAGYENYEKAMDAFIEANPNEAPTWGAVEDWLRKELGIMTIEVAYEPVIETIKVNFK